MKKLIFVFTVLTVMTFASCRKVCKNNCNVKNDTTKVDTTLVDTITVDSTVCPD